MITIYCDGSFDATKNIGTWGFLLIDKNKTYEYSGICSNATDSNDCELRAIVKALGIVKSFNAKRVLIYTDSISVALLFEKIKINKRMLQKVENCNLWNIIIGYYWKRAYFDIRWISRQENIAHKLAYEKLKEIRVFSEGEIL